MSGHCGCLCKWDLPKRGLREFLPGLLLWLYSMVEIILPYDNQMYFLVVIRICGDTFF